MEVTSNLHAHVFSPSSAGEVPPLPIEEVAGWR